MDSTSSIDFGLLYPLLKQQKQPRQRQQVKSAKIGKPITRASIPGLTELSQRGQATETQSLFATLIYDSASLSKLISKMSLLLTYETALCK